MAADRALLYRPADWAERGRPPVNETNIMGQKRPDGMSDDDARFMGFLDPIPYDRLVGDEVDPEIGSVIHRGQIWALAVARAANRPVFEAGGRGDFNKVTPRGTVIELDPDSLPLFFNGYSYSWKS